MSRSLFRHALLRGDVMVIRSNITGARRIVREHIVKLPTLKIPRFTWVPR